MKVYPQSLRMFKMKSIFVRILMFFIAAIFLSIILVGYISYGYSSNLLIREVMDSNLMLIKQARNDNDKEIASLDKATFQLSLQPKVKMALYSYGDDWINDPLLYTDVIRTLSSVKMTNQGISELWVQLFNSNVILNNNAKYTADFYMQDVYPYTGPVDWNMLKKKHPGFISMGRQQIQSSSGEQTVISFARTISVDDEVPQGIACVNVEEGFFGDALNSIGEKTPSITYVTDSEGNRILSSKARYSKENEEIQLKDLFEWQKKTGSEEGYLRKKMDGRDCLIVFTTSKISKWRYITVIPTEVITEKANKIREITAAAAFLCLILGLGISYLLTGRIYTPINEIITYINAFQIQRKVREGEVKENELVFINRIISYVYNENENLKDLFEQNLPVLKEKFLYDLLEGKISEDEFYDNSRKFEMEFPFRSFEVIVLDIEDTSIYHKAFKAGLHMERTIDEVIAEKYSAGVRTYSLRKGADKIIIVVNHGEDAASTEIIYDFITETRDYFLTNYEMIFTVGIGNAYGSAKDVAMSLIDALSALKYKMVKGQGSITHIDEIRGLPEHIFEYSIEMEKQIMNLAKTGDIQRLRTIVDEVIHSNLKRRETSPEVVENLFNALAGTAVRTIYEVRATVHEVFGSKRNIYRELFEKGHIESKREFIFEIFQAISSYISSRKQGNSEKIMERVKEFVDGNYSSDLSLAQVGEAVGLSSAYLSSIFKEISGEGFVGYINTVRIEKAKQYLQQPELTVIQVAGKVGFSSSNTFIKVFKKHEGITPGQFRESRV